MLPSFVHYNESTRGVGSEKMVVEPVMAEFHGNILIFHDLTNVYLLISISFSQKRISKYKRNE